MSIRRDSVTGRPRLDHSDADLRSVSWTVTRTQSILRRAYNRLVGIIATQDQHTDQLRAIDERLDRMEQKLNELSRA